MPFVKKENQWIDLQDLPTNKSGIIWKESVGIKCRYQYNNNEGELEIISIPDKNHIEIKIYDKVYTITKERFKLGKLEQVFPSNNYVGIDMSIGAKIVNPRQSYTIIDIQKFQQGQKYVWKYLLRCDTCGAEKWIEKKLIPNYNAGCASCGSNKLKDPNRKKSERNTHKGENIYTPEELNYTGKYAFSVGDKVQLKHQEAEILGQYIIIYGSNKYKAYQYKCLKCGYIGYITETSIKRGQGCPRCNWDGYFEVGYNDIATTDPWMIPYFQGGKEEAQQYKHWSTKKLQFKCPYCGKLSHRLISIAQLYQFHSINCECESNDSIGEVILANIFGQFNINYIQQYSCVNASWIEGQRRYDFYLPDYNAIVEVNGAQHYNQHYEISPLSLEEIQRIDKLKKDMALNNGIKYYFEIDARNAAQYIIQYLDKCKDLFELLNIDITKADLQHINDKTSIMTLVNDVDEYIRNNPDARKKQLKEQFNMNDYKYGKVMSRLNNLPIWYRGKRKENLI